MRNFFFVFSQILYEGSNDKGFESSSQENIQSVKNNLISPSTPLPPPPPPFPNVNQTNQAVQGNQQPKPDRSALLNDIKSGIQLKKTTTNDRSVPNVGGTSSSPKQQNVNNGNNSKPNINRQVSGLPSDLLNAIRARNPENNTQKLDSDVGSNNSTLGAVKISDSSGNIPIPPPLPNTSPNNEIPTSPPPPPPPPQSSSVSAKVEQNISQDRSGLFDQIRNGVKLKPVVDQEKNPRDMDQRDAMLQQIRDGVKLRKVEKQDIKTNPNDNFINDPKVQEIVDFARSNINNQKNYNDSEIDDKEWEIDTPTIQGNNSDLRVEDHKSEENPRNIENDSRNIEGRATRNPEETSAERVSNNPQGFMSSDFRKIMEERRAAMMGGNLGDEDDDWGSENSNNNNVDAQENLISDQNNPNFVNQDIVKETDSEKKEINDISDFNPLDILTPEEREIEEKNLEEFLDGEDKVKTTEEEPNLELDKLFENTVTEEEPDLRLNEFFDNAAKEELREETKEQANKVSISQKLDTIMEENEEELNEDRREEIVGYKNPLFELGDDNNQEIKEETLLDLGEKAPDQLTKPSELTADEILGSLESNPITNIPSSPPLPEDINRDQGSIAENQDNQDLNHKESDNQEVNRSNLFDELLKKTESVRRNLDNEAPNLDNAAQNNILVNNVPVPPPLPGDQNISSNISNSNVSDIQVPDSKENNTIAQDSNSEPRMTRPTREVRLPQQIDPNVEVVNPVNQKDGIHSSYRNSFKDELGIAQDATDNGISKIREGEEIGDLGIKKGNVRNLINQFENQNKKSDNQDLKQSSNEDIDGKGGFTGELGELTKGNVSRLREQFEGLDNKNNSKIHPDIDGKGGFNGELSSLNGNVRNLINQFENQNKKSDNRDINTENINTENILNNNYQDLKQSSNKDIDGKGGFTGELGELTKGNVSRLREQFDKENDGRLNNEVFKRGKINANQNSKSKEDEIPITSVTTKKLPEVEVVSAKESKIPKRPESKIVDDKTSDVETNTKNKERNNDPALQKKLILENSIKIKKDDGELHNAHYEERALSKLFHHGKLDRTTNPLKKKEENRGDFDAHYINGKENEVKIEIPDNMVVQFKDVHKVIGEKVANPDPQDTKHQTVKSSSTTLEFKQYPGQHITQKTTGSKIDVEIEGQNMVFNIHDNKGKVIGNISLDKNNKPIIECENQKDLDKLQKLSKNMIINGKSFNSIANDINNVKFNSESKSHSQSQNNAISQASAIGASSFKGITGVSSSNTIDSAKPQAPTVGKPSHGGPSI